MRFLRFLFSSALFCAVVLFISSLAPEEPQKWWLYAVAIIIAFLTSGGK